MVVVQNFQVLSFKKGEFDKEKKELKSDLIKGFITPKLKDLNKELIEIVSEDEMYFDTYMKGVTKELRAGVLYKGKFEIPRYIEKGSVNLRLIEIL